MTKTANHPRFLIFFICMLASAGQLGIDIYVPALPTMARFFQTSPQAIQSSVTSYLVAYAFGQLIFGPLADAYGRRKMLALGMAVFTCGCLLTLAANNLETFVLARCLQGFGIAATNLLAKAIITDSFSGQALMHVFTYMATAWGLAPILAPVVGAHLQTLFGWRSCLIFLLVYSFAVWFMLWRFKETLKHPVHLNPKTLIKNARVVLTSPVFQSCFLAQGLCYSIILVFNIVGPFMVQDTLHKPPTYFGYLALAIGLMYFLGGISNRVHHLRLPTPEQRLRICARVMTGAAIAMLILSVTVGLNVWTLMCPVLLMGLCAGAMYPTLMAKGNSIFPHIAGLTSAILGFALILVSSIMMGLAGFVPFHSLTPMAVFFVIVGFTVMITVRKFLHHFERPVESLINSGNRKTTGTS
ncbi:MFS transporter [Oxalobacteraceae bacterium CAVE-383]|nr:MFS transporter [Oxalobacteraceae bacterium CAVE-383]